MVRPLWKPLEHTASSRASLTALSLPCNPNVNENTLLFQLCLAFKDPSSAFLIGTLVRAFAEHLIRQLLSDHRQESITRNRPPVSFCCMSTNFNSSSLFTEI